jgi:hypothetical protein
VSGRGGVGKKVITKMMGSVRSVVALPGVDMWSVMEVGKRPTFPPQKEKIFDGAKCKACVQKEKYMFKKRK